MVNYIPPPDPREILPPCLACLPTAFASPRPPPALLPLLSPILRQRVQLLSSTATSSTESWLPLLCWESGPAQKLVDLVTESDAFELHPVSGEIDFGEVEPIKYQRLDEETLQSRLAVADLRLMVILLWCEGDEEGGGTGWRISELRPLEGDVEGTSDRWSSTTGQADAKAHESMMDDALRQDKTPTIIAPSVDGHVTTELEEDDNDDDAYWNQYDNTPGRTPSTEHPPAPDSASMTHSRTTAEADYYAQYAQVQPEMDNDDPSQDQGAIGESTLNGHAIKALSNQPNTLPNGFGCDGTAHPGINQPAASSPSGSADITRLEESADSQSLAEVAIQQHVSTSIKSLFRLCRSTGMERSDFDSIVRTELDTLSMIQDDI